jgi:hypothetical protein
MSSYTTATAILEALVSAGVSHLFVNLGSDHPALLEALSKWKTEGKNELRVLTAPNEFVGLCAAQGYFQATGKMQAILVHVDAGTLAMAGAIHNVARARIPVLMIAGKLHEMLLFKLLISDCFDRYIARHRRRRAYGNSKCKLFITKVELAPGKFADSGRNSSTTFKTRSINEA